MPSLRVLGWAPGWEKQEEGVVGAGTVRWLESRMVQCHHPLLPLLAAESSGEWSSGTTTEDP